MFAFGETITVSRPGAATGAYDAQGNPIIGAPTTFTVADVGVAPAASDETSAEFGTVAANGYNLYLPYGSDVRATDSITVRGVSGWQVQGDASSVDWRSPYTGWEAGTVVMVRRGS